MTKGEEKVWGKTEKKSPRRSRGKIRPLEFSKLPNGRTDPATPKPNLLKSIANDKGEEKSNA